MHLCVAIVCPPIPERLGLLLVKELAMELAEVMEEPKRLSRAASIARVAATQALEWAVSVNSRENYEHSRLQLHPRYAQAFQ